MPVIYWDGDDMTETRGEDMQHNTLDELRQQRQQSERPYLEFLRQPTMSAGLYELATGAVDGQQPHTEDELYYVVAGRATILVGEEDIPVQAGSLIFVPANVVHRFHDISEALQVLVFFAPPEYSQANGQTAP
jgi:mannose-6-phosphate isomerase-like protein (cupin superfamily)